jgi:hypothetical protein
MTFTASDLALYYLDVWARGSYDLLSLPAVAEVCVPKHS